MHMPTIEEKYEYRLKRIIGSLVAQHGDLQRLPPDKLQDAIWNDYAKEFGHAVLEDMFEFGGDELFTL